jgi:hypothetical protein
MSVVPPNVLAIGTERERKRERESAEKKGGGHLPGKFSFVFFQFISSPTDQHCHFSFTSSSQDGQVPLLSAEGVPHL